MGERRGLDRFPAARRILRTTLGVLWLGGLAGLVLGLSMNDPHAALGGGFVGLITPGLLWLLHKGQARLALSATATSLLLVGTLILVFGGGVHDIGIALFPGVSMFSALLLDRRQAVFFSALSPLIVGAIGSAEYLGWLHTPFSAAVSPGDIMLQVMILGATSWLLLVLSDALYRSVHEAHLGAQTYREIFNATGDGIFVHDAETGALVDANEAACRLSGRRRRELLAMPLVDFARHMGGQTMPDVVERVHRARDEGSYVFEWRGALPRGGEMWVEVSLRSAILNGCERVIAVVRDIRERKAIAEQLAASERLRTVGQLAGGVAHDFNNQLTVILNNSSLLQHRLAGDEDGLSRLHAIEQCARSASDLTQQLLAFGRKQQPLRKVVDVDGLLAEVAVLLERSIDKRIRLDVQHDGQATNVKGDPALLQNAVLNLALNACDAMPEGGTLSMKAELIRRPDLPAEALDRLQDPGDAYVRVRVEDTGTGIPPQHIERVFDPFFTTKSQGHGMGLAATYGTIVAHDGTVVVRSVVDAGTRIDVYLPFTDEMPKRERRASSQPPPLPVLRVLLAEDDDHVAKGTTALLMDQGSVVTRCADGVAAWDTFQAQPDAFDVAIIDYTMPRMNGHDLALKLHAHRPSLPMIATSGYGESLQQLREAVPCIYLPKPFDYAQLDAALREAVSGASKTPGPK